MTPRVTVVVTSHNRERFLGDALESVLSQSYGDFELLVVDDASTDASAAIAHDMARHDPRIRVLVNAANRGQFANRNHAASQVTTPLFKFHDSDDVMYPHCLQVMVSAIESAPAAAFALSGSTPWPGGPCPMLLSPKQAYAREFLGTGLFHLGPACALFRTPFFQTVGGFSSEGIASDYLFWFKACASGHVLLVPGDLFYYRLHDGQELRAAQILRDRAIARRRAWALLGSPECPLAPDELEQARRNFVYLVARDAYRLARRGDLRAAMSVVTEFGLGIDWLRYLRPPRRSVTAGMPA